MNLKIIKNFLPTELAEKLAQDIYSTPTDWWSEVFAFGEGEPVYVQGDTLDSREKKYGLNNHLNERFHSNAVVYRFKRSTDHSDGCDCYECEFRKEHILGSTFKDVMTNEMGIKDPVLFEQFISVYDQGDFLNIHTDKQRGVAFVLNLTKDWKPEYGGLLNLIPDGDSNEMVSVFPEFNSLVMFSLGDEGVPHFVSEVSSRAPCSRIAISGWYNERGEYEE